MKTLDRKLLRDLRTMWSQALTIALVVASGVGGFLTSLSAVDSLEAAREDFYAERHFADLFATVKRAPAALAEQLRDVDGVADAQTTVEQVVRIQLPGNNVPALGQLIGIDRLKPPRLNQITVMSGRGLFDADGATSQDSIDALVSQGFARARGLRVGDTLGALVNGRHRRLRIVGTAVSPEFVFAGLWGMPDQRGFGIFWVDEAVLAAAYDMQGAFNTVAFRLAPASARRAGEPEVIDALASALQRYGGAAPRGRIDQASHAILDNEIKEQRVLGTALPVIFLCAAAFLLNVVISRLVATQREQIAALKALGYANRAIAAHYLKLVLAIVALGLALGVPLGDWLGSKFIGLYAESFHFAHFEHRLAPSLVLIAAGITIVTAVLGTLSAILATVRLTPAEAMRPPAPGKFRRTLAERLGFTRLAPALRMILRNMERRPLRTGLSIGGVVAGAALNRALGEGDIATGFVLALERGREAEFLQATQTLPRAAGAFSKAVMLRNMQELTTRNILIMSTVLTAFAVVIAVGVVYNTARIALAERTWELASLRVLGFTRAEVSGLLLGELAIGLALALPLGMLAGRELAHLIGGLLASDQFLFPMVVRPRTYALAALAVVIAATASALVVRRRVDRLDMVAALKTRE